MIMTVHKKILKCCEKIEQEIDKIENTTSPLNMLHSEGLIREEIFELTQLTK